MPAKHGKERVRWRPDRFAERRAQYERQVREQVQPTELADLEAAIAASLEFAVEYEGPGYVVPMEVDPGDPASNPHTRIEYPRMTGAAPTTNASSVFMVHAGLDESSSSTSIPVELLRDYVPAAVPTVAVEATTPMDDLAVLQRMLDTALQQGVPLFP
jgi:hypothetical protein